MTLHPTKHPWLLRLSFYRPWPGVDLWAWLVPCLSEGLKSGSPDGGVWSVDGESTLRVGGVNSPDTWLLIKASSSGRCTKQIAEKWMRREGKEENRRGMGRGQTRRAPNLKRGSENIHLFTIVWLHRWHFLPDTYQIFTCLIVFVHHLQPALFKQVPVVCKIAHKVDNDVRPCFFGVWRCKMWLQTITHVHWDLNSISCCNLITSSNLFSFGHVVLLTLLQLCFFLTSPFPT